MFLLWLVVLAIPLIWMWYKITHHRLVELAQKIPGPKTVPILGNILNYVNKTPEDILRMVAGYTESYGDTFRVWLGPFHVAFFFSDPKDVEAILTSNTLLKKNNLYDHLVPWLGTGLLISKGKKWHSRRKIITPTFHFKILEQFLETFNKKGLKMISQMREKVTGTEGQVVDIYPFINTCTLDIICATAMGIELNSQDNQNSTYVNAVVRTSEIATTRFVKVWMRPNFVFKNFYSGLKKEQDELIKLMHDFTDKIITQRREQLVNKSAANEEEQNADNDLGLKKRNALLDVLLNANTDGAALSNADIREEVDTFMFEGHDTTTSGICFALYSISKYPEVQSKMYEEMEAIMAEKKDEGLSYSDLGGLKYMELVIKEVLRIYPPVPMFGRRTEEEFEINGKIIPTNCNIIMSPYLLGRNPEIFPEPEKFIPERFTKENMQDKNPFSYVVFSAGPRNCIGQKFAMLELKSILSKIVYEFELYPSGIEPQMSVELVLRSKNGFKIGMKRRN